MNLGEWAKGKLEEFVPQMDRKIATYFDEELRRNFGFSWRQKRVVREMLQLGKEYALRRQKRLRSSLVYYGYLLGDGGVTEIVWDAAVGMDLIQAALLMQDDFMDRDEKRQGGLTLHSIYAQKFKNDHLGDAMAVTLGDALLCLGIELVARSGNKKATTQVVRGINHTAYGQAYDLTLEAFGDWTLEDVLAMHVAKTAIYTYENPLVVGAYLAELPEKVVEELRKYAYDGGLAFQLQDDILGVFGSSQKTGKSADSDLLQGKCTLLVLKVFEGGTEGQKDAVRKVWGKQQAAKSDLEVARAAIKDSGSYGYSRRLAREYAAKAAKTASKLRDLGLNSEAIDYLQGIAECMVEREV